MGDDKKAELDVTTSGAGIYMVLITPTNKDVVYNPVFVSSAYDITADPNSNTWAISELASYASTDAAAKKSTTTLTKEAKTDEVSPDDVKWITTAIGDTVHFTVKTTIPGFGNAFVKPFFKMTDKLTDLALVSGSVKIKAPAAAAATGAATITEHTTDYNIDNVKTAEYHFVNQGTEAQIKWTETPPVELPHQFVNTQGLQLPSTGGMGTTLLYVGGSILVLAAVILLVTKRRMSSEE